jgi:BirA family biotin operon repressor/biotin-[acetyl-CoA-carboxylase] ligase
MMSLLNLAGAVRPQSCPSTQEIARDLAREGAPEGTVVIAGTQTAGRGRGERTWHSPPGLGLWMSFVLRPRVDAAAWPALTALTALAAAEAIEGLHPAAPAGAGARRPPAAARAPGPPAAAGGAAGAEGTASRWSCAIKWPNDLFGHHGKLAGILAETAGNAVVLGLGLNLAQRADDFPPELRERASSLRLEGFDPVPTAETAADAVNERLTAAYRAFQNGDRDFLREGLRARFLLRGARVSVAWPGGGAEGIAVDLGPTGELILETAAGRHALVAGEVAAWSRGHSRGETTDEVSALRPRRGPGLGQPARSGRRSDPPPA